MFARFSRETFAMNHDCFASFNRKDLLCEQLGIERVSTVPLPQRRLSRGCPTIGKAWLAGLFNGCAFLLFVGALMHERDKSACNSNKNKHPTLISGPFIHETKLGLVGSIHSFVKRNLVVSQLRLVIATNGTSNCTTSNPLQRIL